MRSGVEDELPSRIATAIREARAAWPGIVVADAVFAAYLAGRGADDDGGRLHESDFYLACACAEGDPQAVAELDRVFLAPLAAVVVHAGFPTRVGADVVSILRERLLVRDGERSPRIIEYRGRSALGWWLRVAAVREAGKLRRHESLHAHLRPEALPPPKTPEEEAIRARYGKVFEAAFAEAFRTLPSDDRLTLRLHFTEGLNLDGLALTLGFSRATAGRRLLQARTRLKEESIRLFGERLDASGTEAESLLDALRSDLELSFGALVTSAS
jgi:RNA polymerase sigma-70 factor (ECF subfamily)